MSADPTQELHEIITAGQERNVSLREAQRDIGAWYAKFVSPLAREAELKKLAVALGRYVKAGVVPEADAAAQLRLAAQLFKLTCPDIEDLLKQGIAQGGVKLLPSVVASSAADYCQSAPAERPYIVKGILYEETANQLMGFIKAGKTTWLFALIYCVRTGRDFIGLKTKPVNILYVTEQPRSSFQDQLAKAKLDRESLLAPWRSSLHVLDLGHLWSLDWAARVDVIRENAEKLDAKLVIVDTFPRIAQVEELQDAGEMNQRFEQIAPLVVADHRTLVAGWHERKAGGTIFDAASGTVASGGAMDMLIRVQRAQGAKTHDRQRVLEIAGRFAPAFTEPVTVVLTNDMTDYQCLGSKKAAVRKKVEQQILDLLPDAAPGLTRQEIDQRLESEAKDDNLEPPSESTVTRALEQLVTTGLVVRSGEGGQGARRSEDPYRYHGVTQSAF